jgi:hypothetical protein
MAVDRQDGKMRDGPATVPARRVLAVHVYVMLSALSTPENACARSSVAKQPV